MIDNKVHDEKTILVVDDTPEILHATSRLLRKAEYTVIEASTGGECMDQIHREHPDLVLLDIMLPDADGMVLTEKIKSDPRMGDPFVILLSSQKISTEDRIRGLTIGADGYLTRPISNRDLVAHVDAFFRIKAMEKALREDKENLRITLESIGDAVVTVDQAGQIVTLNPAAERLCGWSREEAHCRPFAEVFRLVDETTLHERENLVHRVLREGTIIELSRPTLLITKKGQEIPVADSAAPIRSATGAVVGVVLVFQDVTVQRQNEKEIARVTEDWELIFESIGHPAWILNRDHTLLRVNRLAADLLNKLPRELVGLKCYDVFHGCQAPPEGCPLSTSIRSGHTEQQEMEIEVFDRVFICSCTPVVEKGQVAKVIHIATDITARRQAEKALRESEERFRIAQELSPDGFTILHPVRNEQDEIVDFTWLYENQTIARINETDPQEVIGKRLLDLFPTHRGTSVFETYLHVANTGKPQILEEVYAGEVLSKPTWLRLVVVSMGRDIAILSQDITERKLAEAEKEKLQSQLIQAQKMESVGRLAGGVAHDFNNILSVIIGYTELAINKVMPDDSLFEDLSEVLNAARRSTDITRQLLAFARRQTIAPAAIDLNETVGGMLKMLHRLIGEDIDLAWQPGFGRMPVFMDPSQLDQLLANLCVNARDAIAGVGKLTIETDHTCFDAEYCADHAGFIPGEFIMLAVSDDGCGMDKDTLDKVFEPFFTTKGVGKGTGLGLSTVFGIVKQNNGFINVYSEPEKGTVFKIYLPVHGGEDAATKMQETDNIPVGRGEVVLVVEDEISILKLAGRILEHLGYAVLTASTPGEALALAEEPACNIDLLLTDVVMPEMNGRQLAEQLKSHHPKLKVLFMSGYTANVIAHRGVLDEGMNFIQKPFANRDLAVKVRKAIELE